MTSPCDAAIDLADFDYDLPRDRIAQTPARERDAARMLVLERTLPEAAPLAHCRVRDLPDWLRPGDLLVRNATRVLAARLLGRKRNTGGSAEALVLGPVDPARPDGRFRALVGTRGRLQVGIELELGDGESAQHADIVSVLEGGEVVLEFPPGVSPYALGRAPLPPYIQRSAESLESDRDEERYQTVFARVPGSVAAPTAGLHFTAGLFERLAAQGVEVAEVVLHVGPGTFRPLRSADLERGRLHAEPFALPEETADAVARTRASGGRVVAVGTTAARVLEARATPSGGVTAGCGETDLFLRPGRAFRVVDALLTNFHLPRSSLLLLVAAFAGRDRTLAAYAEAVRRGYRFYSYGDAMLVL